MSDKKAPGYVPNAAYSPADWNAVSDNPAWTAEDFARARPFAEVHPGMAAALQRGRGTQKTPTKDLTAIRLERGIPDSFRATGRGWQSRIDAILKKAVKSLR